MAVRLVRRALSAVACVHNRCITRMSDMQLIIGALPWHVESSCALLVAHKPDQDTCLAQQALERHRAVLVARNTKKLQLLQFGKVLGCTAARRGCEELKRVRGSEVCPQLSQLPHPGCCPAQTCRFHRPWVCIAPSGYMPTDGTQQHQHYSSTDKLGRCHLKHPMQDLVLTLTTDARSSGAHDCHNHDSHKEDDESVLLKFAGSPATPPSRSTSTSWRLHVALQDGARLLANDFNPMHAAMRCQSSTGSSAATSSSGGLGARALSDAVILKHLDILLGLDHSEHSPHSSAINHCPHRPAQHA